MHIGTLAFDGTPWLEAKQAENPLVIVNHILINGKACTGAVIIPDGVTSIGVSTFNWCGSLKSIKIPDSVTSIGNSVFSGCTSLKSIEIPNSVTSIGDSAFRGCINLTSIIIPNSVTSMGDEVFNMCKAITVYCEMLEKPSEWSERWNYSNYGNCYVVWGYKKN